MDIPGWLVWIYIALALLETRRLVRVIHRLRKPDPAVRSEARLELLDACGGLLLFCGLILSLVVAASWFWLIVGGGVLAATGYAVKGVRRLHAHRRVTP